MKWQFIKTIIFHSLVLGLILVVGTGCGHFVYVSGPYRGKVIDSESKTPIEGAAVLAIWYREASGLGGHGPAFDYHDAVEVLTDAHGDFTVPRETHFTIIGKINEPDLIIYYPGYAPYPSLHTKPGGKEVLEAYENHFFAVELPKLQTREERIKNADLPVEVDSRVPEKKMPNMYRLINIERKELGFQPIGGVKELK